MLPTLDPAQKAIVRQSHRGLFAKLTHLEELEAESMGADTRLARLVRSFFCVPGLQDCNNLCDCYECF
jgi:hypothetical protein